jgi:hypothetical protein
LKSKSSNLLSLKLMIKLSLYELAVLRYYRNFTLLNYWIGKQQNQSALQEKKGIIQSVDECKIVRKIHCFVKKKKKRSW